jgi:hypothetical protein
MLSHSTILVLALAYQPGAAKALRSSKVGVLGSFHNLFLAHPLIFRMALWDRKRLVKQEALGKGYGLGCGSFPHLIEALVGTSGKFFPHLTRLKTSK